MPIVNRIAAFSEEIAEWRRDLHAHPELDYDVHRTAGIVAEKLKSFGCDEVVTGIGRTGVVGVIRGSKPGDKVIGMRADMDALPIHEATNKPYASKTPGKMHACGHDGHTSMLLGAAKYLAETRNFAGTAVVIFQPAEEGGGGGRAMVEDGMMERFGITDQPHGSIDTVMITSQLITALQSVVSRNVDPLESAVLSITLIRAGDAFNVLPQTATLKGTVRTLNKSVQDLIERRMTDIVNGICSMHEAKAHFTYDRGYPVTRNHEAQTYFAAKAAGAIVGDDKVDLTLAPTMGAEDFSYMLEARPGAFIFIGNGDSAGLHHPAYDFNDQVIPIGVSYWARLIESAMPA